MGRDKEFEDWFDEYFFNQQGDDSPYMYQDVKIAFYSGWKAHKKSLSRPKHNIVKLNFPDGKLKN